MSKVSNVAEARKKLEETLKLIVESDDNLLGAMIVDNEEGLPLVFVPKSEAFEIDVGPSGEEEEALGGTILDSFNQFQKLISPERLNLGKLKRVLLEGDKGIAIIYPMSKANAVLLLYGKKGIKVGFIYTILGEIIEEMETLSKIALGAP